MNKTCPILILIFYICYSIDTLTVSLGSNTEKTFKALLLRVHPDKHPNDERATRICQDVKTFYDDCLAATPVRKKKKSSSTGSPSGMGFPLDFNVTNKWSHIQYGHLCVQPQMRKSKVSIAVALQCINARGAIAHGRRTESIYVNESVAKCTETSAKKLFKSQFGGAKELKGVDDIKDELIKNGPVVSTSFCPSSAFVSNNSIQQHEILIVGWKQLATGEAWIVQPLAVQSLLQYGGNMCNMSQVAYKYIPIGQFGIDKVCLAPKSNLENVAWEGGPYFDTPMMKGVENVWLSWPSMECFVSSIDGLFKGIGTLSYGNLVAPMPIVTVRNKNKIAHSRKAALRSVKWEPEKSSFKVTFTFIR